MWRLLIWSYLAPAPQIGINLFTEDPNPPHQRQSVNGIVTAGTPLLIAFKTNGKIAEPPGVTVNGLSLPSQPDQPTMSGDPNTEDYELGQPFTPSAPGIYTITATGADAFLKTAQIHPFTQRFYGPQGTC
jgi:hypothetical protein